MGTEPVTLDRVEEIRERWSVQESAPGVAPSPTEAQDYQDVHELLAMLDWAVAQLAEVEGDLEVRNDEVAALRVQAGVG
jgi:hypothetical protein